MGKHWSIPAHLHRGKRKKIVELERKLEMDELGKNEIQQLYEAKLSDMQEELNDSTKKIFEHISSSLASSRELEECKTQLSQSPLRSEQ